MDEQAKRERADESALSDEELDEVSGGAIEIRELVIKANVDPKAARRDVVIKGKKILEN